MKTFFWGRSPVSGRKISLNVCFSPCSLDPDWDKFLVPRAPLEFTQNKLLVPLKIYFCPPPPVTLSWRRACLELDGLITLRILDGIVGLHPSEIVEVMEDVKRGCLISKCCPRHPNGKAGIIDLSKKRQVLKCEEVRTFSRCITSKTITYQFSVGFINVYRSRKAIFYFQDLETNFYQPLDGTTGNKSSN